MRLEFILSEINRLIESETDERVILAYRRVRGIILGLDTTDYATTALPDGGS